MAVANFFWVCCQEIVGGQGARRLRVELWWVLVGVLCMLVMFEAIGISQKLAFEDCLDGSGEAA
jgi:hypothetical protein